MVCGGAYVGCVCGEEIGVSLYFVYLGGRRGRGKRADESWNRFKGAYCSVWEKEPCLEIFGEMDIMADSLPEMARKVVEAAKS
jgi:hypothetical protein